MFLLGTILDLLATCSGYERQIICKTGGEGGLVRENYRITCTGRWYPHTYTVQPVYCFFPPSFLRRTIIIVVTDTWLIPTPLSCLHISHYYLCMYKQEICVRAPGDTNSILYGGRCDLYYVLVNCL